MLAHHQAMDTFVGDDIIRRVNENNGPESRICYLVHPEVTKYIYQLFQLKMMSILLNIHKWTFRILWVGSAPENNCNFPVMLEDHQVTRLMEDYSVSFTVDLKAASLCVGIMSGRYPCIWCTWDKRNGFW